MQKEEKGIDEGNIVTKTDHAVGSSMFSGSTGTAIDRSNFNNVDGPMCAITINIHGAMGDEIGGQTTDVSATCDDQSSLWASTGKRRRSADHQADHRPAQVTTSASTTIEDFNAFLSKEERPPKRCKTVDVSQDTMENVVRGVGPADLAPSSSSAKRYMRLQLCHQLGHPFYVPGPNRSLSLEYRKKGIRVGDVGRITRDGDFDFLFNACLPADHPANPSVLPDGYEPIKNVELSELPLYYDPSSHLMSESIEYISATSETFHCMASEGAILVLPDGATLYKAANPDIIREFACHHTEKLYSFFNQRRGPDALNGSFYIACIKSESWGIATFDRPSQPDDYLQFMAVSVPPNHRECMSQKSGRRYEWKWVGAATARVGPRSIDIVAADGEEMLNQCTFLPLLLELIPPPS